MQYGVTPLLLYNNHKDLDIRNSYCYRLGADMNGCRNKIMSNILFLMVGITSITNISVLLMICLLKCECDFVYLNVRMVVKCLFCDEKYSLFVQVLPLLNPSILL